MIHFTYIDYVIFLLLIFFLFLAIYLEFVDIYCNGDSNCSIIQQGNNANFYKGNINLNDNIFDIFKKIRINARYDLESVYWRRSLILAIFISSLFFFLFFLPLLHLSHYSHYSHISILLLILVLFIYIILYFTFLFYQKQVSFFASKNVNNNINIIKSLIN